jgi:hypothetical protein
MQHNGIAYFPNQSWCCPDAETGTERHHPAQGNADESAYPKLDVPQGNRISKQCQKAREVGVVPTGALELATE